MRRFRLNFLGNPHLRANRVKKECHIVPRPQLDSLPELAGVQSARHQRRFADQFLRPVTTQHRPPPL